MLHRGARLAGAAAAFSFTTWLAARFAFHAVFSWFPPYDDEGYLLISLKLFRQGHALYDSVYSQYGPFYYEFMDLVLSVFRQSVTHDAGRFLTIAIWIVTSLFCGVVAFVLTRNLWIGATTHLLTALALDTLRNEPMHPGGLICLVLGCIAMVLLLMPERPRLAWTLLGVLGGALLMTKINVGIFALLAIGFVALGTASRRWLAITGAFITAVPLLLMMAQLRQPWVLQFVVLITAAIVPLVLLGVVRASGAPSGGGTPWAVGGAVTIIVLAAVIAMLRGTTLQALVTAVCIAPLRQASVLTVPLSLPPHSIPFALLCAAAGVLAVWKPPAAILRLAAALAMWSAVPDLYTYSIRWGFFFAPLAWVAALPVRGIPDPPALAFARRLLPLLAVLQALHAYPVAGSHIQWGAFLLFPVAAIFLVDGARQLGRLFPIAVFAIVATMFIVTPLRRAKWEYAHQQPLGLPGAEHVRLPPAQISELRTAVTMLNDPRCKTLFTAPGLPSFYFWSRREPATGFNATLWNGLFDAATQRRVIGELERADGLCILEQDHVITAWAARGPCPLCEHLLQNFVPFRTTDRYSLLHHK